MIKLEGELSLKYKWLMSKLQTALNIFTIKEVQTIMFNVIWELVDYDELVSSILNKLKSRSDE